ncbi:MAG: hypothetical protein AAF307_04395 [Pseudomonadota bacterium]
MSIKENDPVTPDPSSVIAIEINFAVGNGPSVSACGAGTAGPIKAIWRNEIGPAAVTPDRRSA